MLFSISIGYSNGNCVIGQSSWSFKVNRCNYYGKTRCNFILHFSDWGFYGRQLSWLTYRSIRMSRLKVPLLSWRLWNKWPYIFCLITWQIGQVPYRYINFKLWKLFHIKMVLFVTLFWLWLADTCGRHIMYLYQAYFAFIGLLCMRLTASICIRHNFWMTIWIKQTWLV